MITKSNIDLRTVNPQGRLDVLGYNLAQKYVTEFERSNQLPGLWDSIQSDIQEILITGLSGITIPTEAMIMLKFMTMNRVGKNPPLQGVKEGQR